MHQHCTSDIVDSYKVIPPQSAQVKESELMQKRELLLEKNTTLGGFSNTSLTATSVDTLQLEPTTTEGDRKRDEVGESPVDVINDIMSLNEEVEVMDEDMTITRKQLKKLAEIISHAQYEDIGEKDEYEEAAKLSAQLSSDYHNFKSVEGKLHEIVRSFEQLRLEKKFSDTPLQYMMQLPPLRDGEEGRKEREGRERRGVWLHTLPDRLMGKTNCEIRVEICLLDEMTKYAEELQQR